METLHAAILGAVQGIAEFLPVSSSGHLIITPWFFGWQTHGLSFDVALHIGTLVAVVAFFVKDLWQIIKAFFQSLWRRKIETLWERMAWLLVVGSIPGAVIGVLLEKQAETTFRQPLLIAGTLVLIGVVLYLADRFGSRRRELGDISWVDSVVIGVSQALAIVPGVSRAGITISAGLFRGLKRETAARFSFLLATPIIAGAAISQAKGFWAGGVHAPDIAGVLMSAIIGFIVIKYLLQYLKNGSYLVFVVYRIVLAAVIVGVWMVR